MNLTPTDDDPTAAAFADPQVGDYFHEMYTVRMFVVGVHDDGRIAVMTATAAARLLPDDGELTVYADADAYRRHFQYDTRPGRYWVRLAQRGFDVTGWFDDAWPAPVVSDQPPGVDPDEPGGVLPDPHDAAERVAAFITKWGDGRIDTCNGQPLYARDLEALVNAVGVPDREPTAVPSRAAAVARVKDELL